MMKLKLEPNILITKYSKEGVFDKVIDQAKVKISQCLLTPHLTLRSSTQVPEEKSENSKGFFNTNPSNVFINKFLCLTRKSLDFSGKKKALLIPAYSLFSQESFYLVSAFRPLFKQCSSLSSSIVINPNTN